ncbi:Rho GTPase activation protein [Dichotomocladium elegans]|nr:Rho GTPase activation protein [Dichotomocladium elegans]
MADSHRNRSLGSWVKRMSASGARTWPGHSYTRKSAGVFGVPLIESVCYARSTVGYVDEESVKHRRAGIIPLVVAKCGSFLKAHALHIEGVFRKPGGMKRVAALQTIFDDPRESYGLHLNWLGYSVHDAANLLCRYLQRLPEPVIPHSFYEGFRDVMSDRYYHETKHRIQAFQDLIKRLPIPHQHLLLYLLDLLSLFASHEDENRMGATNLAVVFGPTILRHPKHNDPIQHRISQRVLEFLIAFQAMFTMKMLNWSHPAPLNRRQTPPPACLSQPSQLPRHQQQQQPQPPAALATPVWSVRVPSPAPDAALFRARGDEDDRTAPQPYHDEHVDPEASAPSSSPAETPNSPPPHKQQQTMLRFRLEEAKLSFSFWPMVVMVVLCIIIGTCAYEVYQAIQCCCCLEPYVFFGGFTVYWILLIRGIPWLHVDEDEQLSLFDDISEQAKDVEELILRDAACEWHSLFSRSWRDHRNPAATIDADQMSITSVASRFDEEGAESTCSDEVDTDNALSFDIASVELQAMWKRQQDVDLTFDVHKEEEWKIRRYSQPQ